MNGRRLRQRAVATVAAGVVVSGLGVGPALAAPPGDCPDPYPLEDVARGLSAQGWTVDEGTTPEAFDVTVAGVLRDGIAPGVDMILADTDSPAIQAAGGIWAGMSGSPVYTEDGRLLGAISYGLSYGPSSMAGITPAADMEALLSAPAAGPGASVADDVDLPGRMSTRLVDSGAVTAAEASDGLSRLPIPLGVSGLVPSRTKAVSTRVNTLLDGADVRVYRMGAAPAAADPGDVTETLEPGGNVAASASYGDATFAGVGTVTAVCGDEALAFGHPFAFSGASAYAAHGADAVAVQDDPAYVPYKVANLTGLAGTVDQDRLAGIRVAGSAPSDTMVVSSHITGPGGRERTGTTRVTEAAWVADVAWTHLLSNVDRVADRIGDGQALLHWTVRGTRPDGSTWTLRRTNRFADRYDVSWVSGDELAGELYDIDGNRWQEPHVTSVAVEGSVTPAYRSFRTRDVQAKIGGHWRQVRSSRTLRLVAGTRTVFRVHLVPFRGVGGNRTVKVAVKTPAGAAGHSGQLFVGGGSELAWDTPGRRPASFSALLSSMRSVPRNDAVVTRLRLPGQGRDGGPAVRRGRNLMGHVVLGGRFVDVRVAHR